MAEERAHAQLGRHRDPDGTAVIDCKCGQAISAPSMAKAREAAWEHFVEGNRLICVKCGNPVSRYKAKNKQDMPDGTAQHVHCTYANQEFKHDRGREAREHRDAVAYAWFAGDVTGRR